MNNIIKCLQLLAVLAIASFCVFGIVAAAQAIEIQQTLWEWAGEHYGFFECLDIFLWGWH